MIRHQRQQHLESRVTSIFFVWWLKILYFCVFTLMLNIVFWAFSATVSTFWVTAVALAMWCNAQILLDACFHFAKQKIFVVLLKKNTCIFHFRSMRKHHRNLLFSSSQQDLVHRIRLSFRFFTLSVERPLHWKIRQKYWGRKSLIRW